MGRIALIDDDEDLIHFFLTVLKKEGHLTSVFYDGTSFLENFVKGEEPYDMILSDYFLPDMNGLAIFEEARRRGLHSPFLIMTAYGEVDTAVRALKAGIADYLIKPLKKEVLAQKVASYLERKALEEEVIADRLEKQIIAESPQMKSIVVKLSRLARSNASILLSGESGTGKEVLARMLHSISPRTRNNFVAVNVSAIPETLFESEFFGYRKGAFTGAVRDHEGHAITADGGTLFLDEVSELPPATQAKLLRLLEERRVQPLGSRESLPVDFRLICATNRNLKQLIRSHKFREDLYYRIAVVSIHIPALRQRPEDIIPLARHLLAHLNEEEDLKVLDFTPQAQERLISYEWPGNVRELRNRIYEALLATDEPWVDAHHLTFPGSHSRLPLLSYSGARSRFRKRYLVRLLKTTKGNIIRAAEMSGLSRKAIYDLMQSVGVSARGFRKPPVV